MIAVLLSETAYLAGGFATNLLIAIGSMALGTLAGVCLGRARDSHHRPARLPAAFLTNLCRNVPSFVLLFYLAFLLPVEVVVGDTVVRVPVWIKATLALTIPVIGFASDQYLGLRQQQRARIAGARMVFATAWLQYFLIIIMASATASVIGADEIVGRANKIIAHDSDPAFLLLTYGYVSLWFLAAGLILTTLIDRIVRWGER